MAQNRTICPVCDKEYLHDAESHLIDMHDADELHERLFELHQKVRQAERLLHLWDEKYTGRLQQGKKCADELRDILW